MAANIGPVRRISVKEKIKKLSEKLKTVFGYGILLTLVGGALTFFGYLVALVIGGNIAAQICEFLYNRVIPVIIYASTVLILFGLVVMYLSGEQALTASKKKNERAKK